MLHSLVNRVRNVHPDHRRIVHGMVWVASFLLLSKLVGALKEMAIAWRYGISSTVDAYLFVFNLVSWPVSVWMSVLSVVLIPIVARIRHESPSDLPQFRAQLLGVALLVGLVLLAFSSWGLPALLSSGWLGLPDNTVRLALAMTPILVWLTGLGVLVSLYSTWTMSAGRHANTLLEGMPALAILLGVLLTGGIEPLLWGTVTGTLVQLACLVGPFAGRKEMERPDFRLSSPWWSPFRQGFSVMMVGQLLMSLTGIIDQFFAAHLGEGAISTLGYANRILSLLLGLGATAISRATLPIFSQAHARGDMQVRAIALRWAKGMFGLGICGLLIGWLLAPAIVALLFQRGVFTEADTQRVSEIFRISLFILPFYFSGLVLVSFLASHGKQKQIAMVATVNLLVKIAACFALVPYLGLAGLIVATAVMQAVSAWLCYRSSVS
ncbi:murein biosynthesis integral membrane protein MurJ [Crenobacter cavernae]|uniref:Virulence factor MviN n=1 Tax=Crenobacter cavernae TaxID=2290923 RepID=A0ABY0FEJ1_9NEIS|nr:lipid II flippase MurJ [Crenobacter cavernae]RXZ43458.1 hypothetical protein EBB06_09890 [Crenobacter cavernae]